MDDYQKMYGAGGRFKEQLEAIAGGFREKSAPAERKIEHVEEVAEQAPEIEGYIEKIEKEAELVLVGAAAPQEPKVTLPLTDDQIKKGLHHKIWEGIRWLAEWCLRQLKMVR